MLRLSGRQNADADYSYIDMLGEEIQGVNLMKADSAYIEAAVHEGN